jgi:hypothetical protein
VKRNSEGGGALRVTPLTFTRTVAGIPLFAFVAKMRFSFAPDANVFSCEVFDPLAPTLSLKAISAWAGRSPRRSSDGKNGLLYARSEPGLGRGFDETTITSMPPATPGSATARPGLTYSVIKTKGSRRK